MILVFALGLLALPVVSLHQVAEEMAMLQVAFSNAASPMEELGRGATKHSRHPHLGQDDEKQEEEAEEAEQKDSKVVAVIVAVPKAPKAADGGEENQNAPMSGVSGTPDMS